MISERLLSAIVCTSAECVGLESHLVPDEKQDGGLCCPRCERLYRVERGFVDLMPQVEGEHTSLYVEHEAEFAETLDYKAISAPLLGAGVRQRAIRRLLRPDHNDSLIELGCGNGKFLFWNRKQVDWAVGIDPAPLFSDDALRMLDLCRADARHLPFAGGEFSAAMSIDVLEHLSTDGISAYLAEAWRVLAPGGRLLIFSNTREGSRLDLVVRGARILSRRLGDLGIIDNRRDTLRKSDHVKAISTYEELESVLVGAGFKIERVLFWNGLFQSVIENLLAKLAEAALLKVRQRRVEPGAPGQGTDPVRSSVRGAIKRRGIEYRVLKVFTELMWLDIALFGGWRAGPYFVLARREEQL